MKIYILKSCRFRFAKSPSNKHLWRRFATLNFVRLSARGVLFAFVSCGQRFLLYSLMRVWLRDAAVGCVEDVVDRLFLLFCILITIDKEYAARTSMMYWNYSLLKTMVQVLLDNLGKTCRMNWKIVPKVFSHNLKISIDSRETNNPFNLYRCSAIYPHAERSLLRITKPRGEFHLISVAGFSLVRSQAHCVVVQWHLKI